ncbi:KH domain-containing protein [Campylobacter sputorum]|uniref:KH domain-containing protein n=1 Tax=Campylobacter sputorum TaxID=206 RepID=UPI00053BFD72|nr:KH domain-containing protein [Campylobacter sputorum]
MVKNFLLQYSRLIAEFPDQVDIKEEQIDDNFCELTIFAKKSDAGKLIGKDGRIINAIKAVIIGCKAKNSLSYRVTVKSIE